MRGSLFAALLVAAAPALAEVKQVDGEGFESVHDIAVPATPEQTWAALTAPQTWWSKDHTYTGDSSKLYMSAQAAGCFCELLPNRGSIEHMRVVYAQPGKQLRLQGRARSIASEPAFGVMTWTIKPAEGGGSRIGMSYVVSGRVRIEGGFPALAPLVDRVLGEQVAGLKAKLDAPTP